VLKLRTAIFWNGAAASTRILYSIPEPTPVTYYYYSKTTAVIAQLSKNGSDAKQLVKCMCELLFVSFFQEFDVNKDGVISPKEFRRAMENQKIYSE